MNSDPKDAHLSTNQADVLLVTATRVESLAVLDAFKKVTKKASQPKYTDNKTFHDLGIVSGAHVLMVASEMGSGGIGASQTTVREGIQKYRPSAVISVGIAYGLRPDKHKMGDILVSTQLQQCDLQKISSLNGQLKITPRGDKAHASPRLIDRFKNADLSWDGAPVHFGLVLSGDKLVASAKFRDELKNIFSDEAIGGEMEGSGLYVSAHELNTAWIVAKAICDWGDENKDDSNQTTAAVNAVNFVIHVIEQGGLSAIEGSSLSSGVEKTLKPNDSTRHLVERPAEVNSVVSMINRVEDSFGSERIFEWFGEPGIGKTILIDLLIEECNRLGKPWVRIDLKSIGNYADLYSDDPVLLIEEVIFKLSERNNLDMSFMAKAISDYRQVKPPIAVRAYYEWARGGQSDDPSWITLMRVVVEQFITLLNNSSQAASGKIKSITIFFDHTDHIADSELADWIEEWIISAITSSKLASVIVVWVGRKNWKWKRPIIRTKKLTKELMPFSSKQMVELFRINGASDIQTETLSQVVYRLTNGHPFISQIIIDQLSSWHPQSSDLVRAFAADESKFREKVYTEFVLGYVLRDLPEATQNAFKVISATRFFDLELFQEILKQCEDAYQSYSEEDFKTLRDQLEKMHLILRIDKKGHEVESRLRKFIHEYLYIADPKLYGRAHQTALRNCQQWFEKDITEEQRELIIVEEVFHFLCLKRTENVEDKLRERARDHFSKIQIADGIKKSVHSLTTLFDSDEDLQRINSLVHSIGLPSFAKIILEAKQIFE